MNRKLIGIFNYGKLNSPYIIFFDEIDSIANLVNDSLYDEMNKLQNDQNNKIIVIAATNNIEILSSNIRSTFKHTFFFDIPGPNERSIMISRIIERSGGNISEQELQQIVNKTEGCEYIIYYILLFFFYL
jgi:AAA+ superfamily predicted ATPase